MIDINRLKSDFVAKYGGEPRIFRAPGRMNLIGEHTDYNEGFVLPAALNFSACIAGSARADRTVRASSRHYDVELLFDLDDHDKIAGNAWGRYVQGVAAILEREGFRLSGADLLIDSDVPVGAGLSSSAALEIATGFAFVSLAGQTIDGMKLARVGQTAEHEFAGVRSGIMDQFASVFGKPDHALFLDCRSMKWEPISVSSGQFVICNTKTKHDLAEGEYNRRREQCEEAARFFGRQSLRDVTLVDLNSKSAGMPKILKKRARHVITENERVLSSVELLRRNEMRQFGQKLTRSHESLRDDFEVSCTELDLMVDLASKKEYVLGSRMMGGGFGGCTINLIEGENIDDFENYIAESYRENTGIDAEIYRCEIGPGVAEV